MSSAPTVARFKGTNWEECHDFIAAIRARALWEGKQRDSAWKADFAAPLFWGKALAWHSQLPEDVREDWPKLETALIGRWPPQDDDDDRPLLEPTPAAAPSPSPAKKVGSTLQGALKVVPEHSNTRFYLEFDDGICALTSDASEAIRLRPNSVPSATLLERIDHSCHSWLAVQWQTSNPTIGYGSTDYALVTCVGSDTLTSSWRDTMPLQLVTWDILENGEVFPVWKKDDASRVTLYAFVNGNNLYMVTDPVSYGRKYSREARARFFIEPID